MRSARRSICLTYHDIYDGEPQTGVPRTATIYHVSRGDFEQHLGIVRDSGLEVTTVSDWLSAPPGDTSQTIAFTFDDGWSGAFRHAVPLLKKMGWKGTFFITGDFVGKQFFCDSDMILEAFKSGMEVGIHGMTHCMLSSCSSREIEWEFRACKDLLESLVNSPVQLASLPGGASNGKLLLCAKGLGIQSICTGRPGVNYPSTSPFNLRRTAILRTTSAADIERYCRYNTHPEVLRWMALEIPRKLLGMKRYSLARRTLLRSKGDHQFFTP